MYVLQLIPPFLFSFLTPDLALTTVWHRPFAISTKSLASSALLYFQPFSASTIADDAYYNHASEQAARLLNLGALENADKYILLANVFLAWDQLKTEDDDSHFPVDDLDSQKIATPQLARLIHAVNEPIISALILSNLSADLVAALLSEILLICSSDGFQSHSCPAATIYCSLLLIPSIGSRFGKLPLADFLPAPSFSNTISSISRSLQERSRTDGVSLTLEILQQFGLPLSSSEEADFTKVASSSHLALINSSSMDIDRSSTLDLPESLILPNALYIAIACVDCQLHDDSVSLCAWQSLSSVSGIQAAAGAENWCYLVETRLLPLFKSSTSPYSISSRLELLQIISELSLDKDQERALVIDSLKALLLEDWNGDLPRDLIQYRLSNTPRLLQGASLAKHGVTATFNAVSDSFDLDVARQLTWLSFVDPNALMRHIVLEMALKKDVALRLGQYLCKLPIPLLPSPSNSLLVESLRSLLSSMTPTSAAFKLQSSNLLQALASLKQLKSEPFKVPLLGPLTLSHDICRPLLTKILAESSTELTTTSELEPLPTSQYDLLKWILELILVDASTLADFGVFLSNPGSTSLSLLELLIECDARLQASTYASSTLSALLDLTETILKCFSTQGLDLQALRKDSNSGPFRLPLCQLKCPWRSLLKCSSDALAIGRTLTGPPSTGNLDRLSATVEKFLPSKIAQFLGSSPLSTLDGPSNVFDLIYTAALGGSIGAKVADRLQSAKLESIEKMRFLRHASVACALILPRLSNASFESVFVNFLLPVASWMELRKLLEANRPGILRAPQSSAGAEPIPNLDNRTKSIVAGNRSGDVALNFSEIDSFLAAVSWTCDALAALICNKSGLGYACYGEGPLSNPNSSDGASIGEAWLALVGKLLNVAICYLGLGASTPLHSHPLPLISLLYVLLHRLCLPIALNLPLELRNGQLSLERLGIFFQMLTGEVMPYSTNESWNEPQTISMRKFIKVECSELEHGWQPAGLCLGTLSVLWSNLSDELN